MSTANHSDPEQALARLEQKIDQLTRAHLAIQQENQLLRHKEQELRRQKTLLTEKTAQAKSRIEAIISRLKAMGAPS